jgi:hypothetical protein
MLQSMRLNRVQLHGPTIEHSTVHVRGSIGGADMILIGKTSNDSTTAAASDRLSHRSSDLLRRTFPQLLVPGHLEAKG